MKPEIRSRYHSERGLEDVAVRAMFLLLGPGAGHLRTSADKALGLSTMEQMQLVQL